MSCAEAGVDLPCAGPGRARGDREAVAGVARDTFGGVERGQVEARREGRVKAIEERAESGL